MDMHYMMNHSIKELKYYYDYMNHMLNHSNKEYPMDMLHILIL